MLEAAFDALDLLWETASRPLFAALTLVFPAKLSVIGYPNPVCLNYRLDLLIKHTSIVL